MQCSLKRVCQASWCWTICNSSHFCSGSASSTQSGLLALASDNAADKLDSSQILGQHSTPWTKKYNVFPFAIEPYLWKHLSTVGSTLKVNTQADTSMFQCLILNFRKSNSGTLQQQAILDLVLAWLSEHWAQHDLKITCNAQLSWTVWSPCNLVPLSILPVDHAFVITAKMAPIGLCTCQICTNNHFLITATYFSWWIS